MAKKKSGVTPGDSGSVCVTGLCKSIARKRVLEEVNLEVSSGTAMAVCGPNGAGKTTLIRILLGLLEPDKGYVCMDSDGRNSSFLFHSPCLFPDLTLRQNCQFFLSSRGKNLNSGKFFDLQGEFGLGNERADRVGTFSRGMLQKADLVRALSEEPEILFLDEPTSHLDPIGKVMVREFLKSRVDAGMTLLVTSHLLGEVEKLADHVCILNHGSVAWTGSVQEDLGGVDLESWFVEVVAGSQGGIQ